MKIALAGFLAASALALVPTGAGTTSADGVSTPDAPVVGSVTVDPGASSPVRAYRKGGEQWCC